MFDIDKEMVYQLMLPFGVLAAVLILLAFAFSAWTAFTSESGDIRIDLEAINIHAVVGDRWIAHERLMKRVNCSLNPSLLESALAYLCKRGTLERTESKRSGRVFYRKAVA